MTQGAILCNPRTKHKLSKNVFAFTSVALSCGHTWARLLQPLAQSLIGSAGTLGVGAEGMEAVNLAADRDPETNIKRSKIALLAVSACHMYLAQLGISGTILLG